MPKVLVVEDSSVQQAYYEQILSQLDGYQASFTTNGRQALDHIAQHGVPDVIVLDINMPVMGGLEFLTQFRGAQETPPARVIIVTTEGHEEDHERGIEAGASAYLKKPFAPEVLTRLVLDLAAQQVPAKAGA